MTRRAGVLVMVALAVGLAGLLLTRQYRRNQYETLRGSSVTAMLEELQRLYAFEDSMHAATGQYVAEVPTAFPSRRGLGRPVVVVTESGWTATITHLRLERVVCGIGIGMENPAKPYAGKWWTDGGPFACRETDGT